MIKHFTKRQQQRIQERQMRKMCTDYRQNEDLSLRLVALELKTLKTIAFCGINVFNVSKSIKKIKNLKNNCLLGD